MASRSKRGRRPGARALALCLVFLPAVARPAPPAEEALAALWQMHLDPATKRADFLAGSTAYQRQFPQEPYLIMLRGLAAWHHLRAGDNAAAETLLLGLRSASDDPMYQAGDRLAKHWLTRLDRERVRAALLAVYARQVSYPATLPAEIQPASDRWGKRWDYRLTTPRFFQGTAAQTYSLRSRRLGDTSDLARALARPYGGAIVLRPVRVDGAVATLARPGGRAQFVLSPGAQAENTWFVHAGESVLLLSDGDHWLLVPRPGQ